MGILYWSAAPIPPVGEADRLYGRLKQAFSSAGSAAYLDELIRREGRPILPSVAIARLSALSLLPPLLARAGFSPASVNLRRDEHHRPYGTDAVGNPLPLDFNLSHSGCYVACGLLTGGGRVGVDVEEILSPARALPLIRRYCTEEELMLPKDPSDRDRARCFTRVWTLREAVSKQEGRGMPWKHSATRIPPSVRVFSGGFRDTDTRIALCVPAELRFSDVIPIHPFPTTEWDHVSGLA